MNCGLIGLPAACRRRTSIEGVSSSEEGFTLFETLIALLVVSIGLVSLFAAQTQAIKTAGISADYVQARIIAQSLLSETMGNPRPAEASAGINSGFRWSIDVTPETEGWARIPARDDWKLFHVRVRVLIDGGRQVELNSLKLGQIHG